MASSSAEITDGLDAAHKASLAHHNLSRTVIASSACNSCRSRKVKCDRNQPVCSACTRLHLRCSYDRRSASPISGLRDLSGYTEAGTKRKRTRQACNACRIVKARCSGISPCERCASKGLDCDLTRAETAFHGGVEPTNIPTPHASTIITSGVMAWPLDKATARRYLEVYFEGASRTLPAFLHKPTILARWSTGKLDPNLLKCIVAFGLFLGDTRTEGRATARTWIQEVQDDAFKRIGQQSVGHLSILVILLRFRFQAGNFSDAWSLLAIAARSAFTLRLNYEHEDDPDPVNQESNRRLMWAIYQLDRLYSGGMEDLTVCPIERMHIRLPCDERSFETGSPSKAAFFNDTASISGSGIDAHAFKLVLLAIRDRILKYTKGVRRKGSSPAESRTAMEDLQLELTAFEQNLPAELKLTSQRFAVMGHSREASAYVGLHALWMLCHCDLHRFCVPGILESASKEALDRTPPDFIEYCQKTCLSMAVRLCRLWSDMYAVESREYFGDEFLAVSIYQVVQILHHLPHLLTEDGENSIAYLKKRLNEALQLAAPLRWDYASAIRCLKDCERLIRALGRGSVAQISPISHAVEREHLASSHTILTQLYMDQDAADGSTDIEVTRGRRLNRDSDGREAKESLYPKTSTGVLDRQQRKEESAGPAFSDMFVFDPFNMQLNGYYDPQLDLSFL
ncbi:hypothetical protein BDW69DRAFT_47296 [Aspergillus filifer]